MSGIKSEIVIFNDRLMEERNYWIKKLSREMSRSGVRPDHPGSQSYSYEAGHIGLDIGGDLYQKVSRLTSSGSFLLLTTLMAALKVCLHKHSGEASIVVGTPALNGDEQQTANAIATVDDVEDELSFRQFLLNVRETLLQSYERQGYPFNLLVKDLGLPVQENRCPLFDVALALKDIHGEMPKLNTDITFTFGKEADRISGVVEFNKNLYEEQSIRRFSAHLINALRAGVENTGALIEDIDILSEAERRQITTEWNQTEAEYDTSACVQDLVEAQAEKTPSATAVVAGAEQLDYRQLNARANQLARFLKTMGVGPERLVGVCAERSPEMVVALLAVLKAGGAYVPLDPSYPKQRLAFMLENAGIRALVTLRRFLSVLPENPVRKVCLDTDWHEIAQSGYRNLPREVEPENLAYVIYTSGSTGTPKGVQIPHRGLMNLVRWHRRLYKVNESDRATLIASPGFDASVWELWPYLCAGASVHIVDEDARGNVAKLSEWLKEKQVTISFLPTPMAEALLAEPSARGLELKALLTGGDKLHNSHAKASQLRLINHYGPTENSVVTTCAEVAAGLEKGMMPPIGKPIANTQVYILDGRLRLVPVGVAGELYITGDGLARGYLTDPQLTAGRFLPNPFADRHGSRLYKTGDLVRLLPDGNIEFIGRNDLQVKVRGYRIELGEIEAVLEQHRTVREAVVEARSDGSGRSRLVAYIVADHKQSLHVSELRGFLTYKLTDYMIPADFVVLDELPLTPNGKLDRKALPEPSDPRAELEGRFLSPRTPVEEVLAGVWAETLGVDRVSIHEDFFAAGGNSLLATQAVSRLANILQVDIPLKSMFELPTIATLAELVEKKLRAGAEPSEPAIKRVPRDKHLPLSFAQQRLWFLDQLEPGSPFYNIAAATRLTGALDPVALERAFGEIIRRHEALRTSFSISDGQPVQIIHEIESFHMPLIDLSGLSEEERGDEAESLARQEARFPFELTEAPLLRATLLWLDEEDHIVLLTMHHIVSDGWSIGVLIREVAALYDAFTRQAPSPLPELAIQYADFAVWQREWLQGEVLESQLSYWRRQLAGAPSVIELPTDRPRPTVQSYRGAAVAIELPKTVTDALKELSRREGVTLFMTLLAAFQALLQRYTGKGDICVGSPIANRKRSEIENLIGFFVNTLVIRTRFSGDPSFLELLARVREVALGAYTHQDVPFEMLVDELQPERSLNHSPLFQVMFALQNAPRGELELPGLTLIPIEMSTGTARFDLFISLREEEHGLTGFLEYDADLFNESTIECMAGHLRVLLECVALNPETPISQLSLLTEAEAAQLLVGWNNTESDFPHGKCVDRLFAEQVARSPKEPAVIFGDQQLSYEELDAQANRLARYLQSLGVGPEAVVGICLDRSVEMIVALVGVLKAGGAYVPLDPAYPADRISFMLEDSHARVLLTEQKFVEKLPQNNAALVCMDADWQVIARVSDAAVDSDVSPLNLAYLIYTSGSTGKPKGVAMSQQALTNLVWWQMHRVPSSGSRRTLQFASLSFDVSFQETFTALCSGASLVLITEEGRRDFDNLLRVISQAEIESLFVPPAALYQINRIIEATGAIPDCLREVIAAGEQLQINQNLIDLFGHLNGCNLRNHYGPSETHVMMEYNLTGSPGDWPTLPPIGRPIANTQVYILDSHMNPVPVGVPGEMYIGGMCLSRGYFDRPELTAERYIPNPFSSEPGARLYKTGDLTKYLPDGNIEFLGRLDHQVKVRGIRVELGEVETVLSEHPAVREAAVVVREVLPGDKRLIAYVVCDQARSISANDLRSFLKHRLPEYMVPSAFVMQGRLPMTPSGKVDRRSLPAPNLSRDGSQKAFVGARTPAQEVLAGIWSDVLGVAEVGINDNFFELGGHSLLATQLVSRVRETFKVELPLRKLFESPTVAGLAESIEAALGLGEQLQSPPIKPISRDQDLPLSFAQQRLWFLDQLEPNSPFYNLAGAIRLLGSLHLDAFKRSIGEIVRRHETLRTRFVTVQSKPVQLIDEPEAVEVPVTDLSRLPQPEREAEAMRLAASEARLPFDLVRGPLLRVSLLRLEESEHNLLLTIHHIISDGWSIGVLIREIASLYEAYSKGEPSPLPEPTIQYADFAHWQREWLQGEVLEAQLSYWKKQLAGRLTVLELPTDNPRPPVPTFQGALESFTLSADLSERLYDLSQREGVTLFMTLLSAFQTLLHRYSKQQEIIVGCDIANRNRAEIENLIGFFVNMLVMRADFSDEPTFNELLGRVRETALGAFARQDLPFEQLVEALQPERDLSRNPLFQVNFVLQNAPTENLKAPGLTFTLLATDTAITRFDITMSMVETPEGLKGSVVYSTDLFEQTTIRRMIKHFENLLESIVADSARRVSDLPILTAAERNQLLAEWNHPVQEYSPPLTIHQLFEAQVKRTPGGVALVFDNQQLTYGELNEQTNRLAHHLQSLGVGPEVPVGICIERSVEMVVGLLAILKAGGAYVPLDPDYPTDRLAMIVEETLVPVLLTEQSLTSDLPVSWARVICLDTDWGMWKAASAENPDSGVEPENLAYIIYTSGSTGRPKGAMLHHEGVCHRLLWGINDYQLGQSHRILNKTVLSFDVSVWEIFAPLISGASLIVAAPGGQQDSAYLIRLISDGRVSHADFVPSMLHVFLEEKDLDSCNSLKLVTAAGEALAVDLQRRFFSRLDADLYNLYGPTEASLAVTYWVCGRADDRRIVPIGKRMTHARIYILDHRLHPVPVGVPGEIYVGGIAVGRGYVNRPDLTGNTFIADPFSERGGERLYKTGDLARFLPDGNIEFLGRVDHQVKVRGFRIELGEIESVLGQNPAVREAVVMVREDVSGDKRLVGYVVPERNQEPTPAELQNYLREALPEYMVPSAFVLIDAMPLTFNGKANRSALPAPGISSITSEEYIAPRSEIEEILAKMWSEVLNVERLGINDNFFNLGGHSLLATQVVGRVREIFHVEIPLRAIFLEPTVASLAATIEAATKEGQTLQAPPIKKVDRNQNLPLSFAQQRLWFIDQMQPESPIFNIPAAVRFIGPLDLSALERTLNEIIRRHEVLRTTFALVDADPVQIIHPPESVRLSVLNLSVLPSDEREAEAARMSNEEAQKPFNLATGPLLRVRAIKMDEQDHIVLFTMHHIISDEWSMGVLIREVAALYKAFSEREPSRLPELTIQYADFAHWQREWLKGEVLERQLSYWKHKLDGAPPVIELPTDRPRPQQLTFRGDKQIVRFSRDLTRHLESLSHQQSVTMFMTLLSAFQILLRHYTGRDDIVVGTDVANRNRFETEPLIGFFVNQLVLRTDLSGDPPFSDLLQRVREVTLGAYEHQDLPFEYLVDALKPERNLKYSPLFQVKLTLQNAPEGELELPDLTLSAFDAGSGIAAKLDLTLLLSEGPEGIQGYFEYNADLFDRATIDRMARLFDLVLDSVAAQPDLRLGAIEERLAELEKREQKLEKAKIKESKLSKLRSVRPKPITARADGTVKVDYLGPGEELPVLHPAADEVDPAAWAEKNRELIEARLLKHGAILFRNFSVGLVVEFERFAGSLSAELFNENGEHPRKSISGKVYTPVSYPAEQQLLWHNENSFNYRWPTKIWFCCLQPATQGGQTPIVDSRKVFSRIEPSVRERFARKGVMYVRNYRDGLGLSWQEVFHASTKSEVEHYCRKSLMEFEWMDGDRLRTRAVRPAIIRHPRTGEATWFNQAQHWHPSCLDRATRESMLSLFGEDDLPRNCYYGDGSPIEDSAMEHILEAYREMELSFDWQKDDILMLDNLLTAHGRNQFVGERRLLVAMGDMLSYGDVETVEMLI